MNLTTDGWIPVANAAGEKRLLSLRQVFAEGLFWQDLAVRPHERVALMRLLIAIAQQSLQEAAPDWQNHDRVINQVRRQPDQLMASGVTYLDSTDRRDCFHLFHPTKPFLQFAGLARPSREDENSERVTAASKLDFALATGDKSTLFDHSAASDGLRVFSPSQLALMLITFQCFALSQPAASLTLNGVLVPSKDGKPASNGKTYCGHGPCLPAAMLHSFVRKDRLLDTIAANLLSSDTVILYRKDQDGHALWGEPVWQWMPTSFGDNEAIFNATQTYLGRLMPISRAILLHPNGRDVLLANGFDYPSASESKKAGGPTPFPAFSPEPSASLSYSEKDGFKLVSAGSRAIWRELPSLIVKRKVGQSGGPLTLVEMSDCDPLDLWVGAMIATKDEGIVDTVEGVYSVPAKMLRVEGQKTYENEIHESERVAAKLGDACKGYREHLETRSQKDIGMSYGILIRVPNKEKGYPEAKTALHHFWNAAEQLLWMLNACIAAEDGSEDQTSKRNAWRSALWRAARDAFHAACAFETPRQKRAFPLGLRALQYIQRKKDEPTTSAAQSA